MKQTFKRFAPLAAVALAPFALAALAFSVAAPGCGLQGEGQLCSHLNNNDDCAAGLVCTLGAVLLSNSDICCPPTGSTNPACVPGGLGTGSGGGSSTSSTSSSMTSSSGGGMGGMSGTTTTGTTSSSTTTTTTSSSSTTTTGTTSAGTGGG